MYGAIFRVLKKVEATENPEIRLAGCSPFNITYNLF